MSLSYKLRRAKWAAKGLANGGTSDFRLIGLGFVKTFHVYNGFIEMHAWAIPSRELSGLPTLVVERNGKRYFEKEIDWSFDQEADAYCEGGGNSKFGLSAFLQYESPYTLYAYIEFSTSSKIYRLELGPVPNTTASENTPIKVTNPWENGQIGDVTIGFPPAYAASAHRDKAKKTVEMIEPVDIIIPVYNGFEYLESLFSSIIQTDIPCRFLIINDCSSDPRVLPFLTTFMQDNADRCTIINNESNLGFVGSVNKGLSRAKGDVVLVNTDVELPSHWLERLIAPIKADPTIATATPLTNSGTICSFPIFLENNQLPFNMTVDEVDSYFKKVHPYLTEAPTGVGFCMAMSKAAIEKVGQFDEKTFGKGYGEENDWCQRAIKLGFTNVIVENLFVYHKHGGSFQSEEKKKLCEKHTEFLLAKHPNYSKDVAKHCADNPLNSFRNNMFSRMVIAQLENKTTLIVTHLLGGGADLFYRQEANRILSQGNNVATLFYSTIDSLYHVVINSSRRTTPIQYTALDARSALSPLDGIAEIIINEAASYPKPQEILEELVALKKRAQANMTTYIHDYLPLCPSINLLTTDNIYCGLPTCGTDCHSCYQAHWFHRSSFPETIALYRDMWNEVLHASCSIICFSESSRSMLESVYGELERLKVIPHKTKHLPAVSTSGYHHEGVRIGILGNLTLHKGSGIVRGLLNATDKAFDSEPVSFIHFGINSDNIEHPLFFSENEYVRDELPELVKQHEVDVFLLPSICPETFSFTCSEIIDMNLPVACFNLGAPAERVNRYEKGLVLDYPNNPNDITEEAPKYLSMIVELSRKWNHDAL